ncbi:MAG TPA: Ig-like domain-containing protein, partial [Gemmatimonadales bacterium]
TTDITDITPETSTSGQTFRVTVRVTGEGGIVPTGTVAVFSQQETGGCDEAPLDSEGIATCDFALDQVGTQTIVATYSGDAQFDSSTDTQQHEVVAP